MELKEILVIVAYVLDVEISVNPLYLSVNDIRNLLAKDWEVKLAHTGLQMLLPTLSRSFLSVT
ncbi:uncharacterized protein G2W53_002029 [Senna tora]|uniref:Uncharacterized protein n=1 Tax=Senna tora TaxID=362788 RepID=A0A834XH15_9FABA|nr:uncharacterized protein G2W53_002029 [Senna tora]